MLVGGITMLMAGRLACYEMDIKKVIAMSTLSQLGFIVYVLSFGEIDLSFVHLVCHALFKALLFLRCGYIIIINYGGQDSRLLSSSLVGSYIISLSFLFSCLSLIGFPFMSGFYSKDLIIEIIFYEIRFLK